MAAEPASTATAAQGISLTSVAAMTAFGLDGARVGEAVAFVLLGHIAGTSLKVSKMFSTGAEIPWARIFGAFGAGVLALPFIAVVVLAFGAALGINSDVFYLLVLLMVGYQGPDGVTALMAQAQSLIGKRLGGQGNNQ